MTEEYAGVTPYQPWLTPGYAHAAPLPPGPYANNCDVPDCKPNQPGAYTVRRSENHHGLVIVNADLPPATTPAVLRLVVVESDEEDVTLGGEENGVVVLFRSK